MRKEFIILGCGNSTGNPKIDGTWGKCKKGNKKNFRTRCSAMLATKNMNILFDTSPDLRSQLLREKVRNIDKVLEEGSRIRRPMLLHLAENDTHTSKAAQINIINFFEPQKTVSVNQYKNCNQQFIDPWNKLYNRSESEIAEIKTLEHINHSFKNPSTA